MKSRSALSAVLSRTAVALVVLIVSACGGGSTDLAGVGSGGSVLSLTRRYWLASSAITPSCWSSCSAALIGAASVEPLRRAMPKNWRVSPCPMTAKPPCRAYSVRARL